MFPYGKTTKESLRRLYIVRLDEGGFAEDAGDFRLRVSLSLLNSLGVLFLRLMLISFQ